MLDCQEKMRHPRKSSEPQAKNGPVFSRRENRGEKMLSRTLTEGLSGYGIGGKVRELRLKKKMGLVELGRHTGLSAALLSKIERGRLFPTLPTLLRIALVFSVGLEYFFTDDRRRRIVALVRRRDRIRLPEKPGSRTPAYVFESLDYAALERRLDAYYAEFNAVPEEKAAPHRHPGVEFLYVLRGKLAMKIGDEDYSLEPGDSIYFDATLPHRYRRLGRTPCAAIVVTVP
jgi:transcriptional regulator with XRE-family HTH domain